jgi:hypothetical protein
MVNISLNIKRESTSRPRAKTTDPRIEERRRNELILAYYVKLLNIRLRDPSVMEPYKEAMYDKIISILISMQEHYWGGASEVIKSEDKTIMVAERYGAVIKAELSKNCFIGQQSINIGRDGSVSMTVIPLSDEFLGIGNEPDSKDPTPIKWLGYFITGTIEDTLLWVNSEIYEIIVGEPSGDLGRFGTGYLWRLSPTRYKALKGILGASGIDITKYIHPQSGKPANSEWFEGIRSGNLLTKLVLEPVSAEVRSAVMKALTSK